MIPERKRHGRIFQVRGRFSGQEKGDKNCGDEDGLQVKVQLFVVLHFVKLSVQYIVVNDKIGPAKNHKYRNNVLNVRRVIDNAGVLAKNRPLPPFQKHDIHFRKDSSFPKEATQFR